MSMQVNLYISGRKLKDLDAFSKSDPQCALYEKTASGHWQMLGKTEIMENNLNPDFETCFTVAYWFEKVQNFKFVMVDVDKTSGEGDNIGEVQVTMGNLMGAKKQTWTANLEQGSNKNRGQIIVRTQAIQQSNYEAKFTM